MLATPLKYGTDDCSSYEREVHSIHFDKSQLHLYTSKISELFTKLQPQYREVVTSIENGYVAKLEQAVKEEESSGNGSGSAANNYRAAITFVKQRAAKTTGDFKEMEQAQVTAYDVNDIKTAAPHAMAETQRVSVAYYASLCSTVHKNLWFSIGTIYHEMGGLVNNAGLNVDQYLSINIQLTRLNVQERLEQQVARPELRAIWSKYNSPVPTLSESEQETLKLFGGVWPVCLLERIAVNQSLELENHYANLLLKYRTKRTDMTSTNVAWELMKDRFSIILARNMTIEKCLQVKIVGRYRNPATFFKAFQRLYDLRGLEQEVEDATTAMHLVNYLLSQTA